MILVILIILMKSNKRYEINVFREKSFENVFLKEQFWKCVLNTWAAGK